jgi:hypothetical protein
VSTLNKLCVPSVVRVHCSVIDAMVRLAPTWIRGCIRSQPQAHPTNELDGAVLALARLVMHLSQCNDELEVLVLNSDLFAETYLPILTAARLPSPALFVLVNRSNDCALPPDFPPDLAMCWPAAVEFLAHLCDQIDLVLLRQLAVSPVFLSVFDAVLFVSAHFPLDHRIHTAVGKIVAAVELLQLAPFQARYSVEACATRIMSEPSGASLPLMAAVIDRQWITAKLIADPNASVHTWAVPQRTGLQCLAAFVTQLPSSLTRLEPDAPLQTCSWYHLIGSCFFGTHRRDGTVVSELALRVCLHAHDTLSYEAHSPRWCSAALVAAAIKVLHTCRHVLPASFFEPAPHTSEDEPPPPLTDDSSTPLAVRTYSFAWSC